ncbi:hypothetical protein GSM99_18310 [Proteus terrae subsp. cibarius]|nr:hypothetical protein GSM99_18310 [Proteus terrae subsp. cibarius]
MKTIVRFIFSQDAFFSTISDTAINQSNPIGSIRQTKNHQFKNFISVKKLNGIEELASSDKIRQPFRFFDNHDYLSIYK